MFNTHMIQEKANTRIEELRKEAANMPNSETRFLGVQKFIKTMFVKEVPLKTYEQKLYS